MPPSNLSRRLRERHVRCTVVRVGAALLFCSIAVSGQEIEVSRVDVGATPSVRPVATGATPVLGLGASFSVPSLAPGAAVSPGVSAAPLASAPRAAVARPASMSASAPVAAAAVERPIAAKLPVAAAALTRNGVGPLTAPSVADRTESDQDPEKILPSAAAAASPAEEGESRNTRLGRFAAATARALNLRREADSAAMSTPAPPGTTARRTALSPFRGETASRAADAVESRATPAPIPGKRPFMIGTFVYNLATSVMLVVQQALFFTLAQSDQLARGVPAVQAGLHAAGVVFILATLVGAMRIPGNSLGAWLSARTDQRNLAAMSSGARAAILAAVGGLVVFHQITLPLAALLYSADWLIGGLEEVSRNTQTMALVEPGSREFKSWSTLSQFLAQLTGLFGPVFVIALAQFKGLASAGHVIAPILFGLAAALYAAVPRDALNVAARGATSEKAPRTGRWRAVLGDRRLLIPVLTLALTSTLLLKGPLSLNMASLLLGKSGADLVTYSALLSGLFGAGLGAGSWLAHIRGESGPRRASPARWLALSAAATAALALSWFFGLVPALVLPAVASAWFFFALANAACQSQMTHRLQESVAAAGPDKKYVVGLSLTLSNVVITVLRVLAGLIFFVAAKNWQTAFGLFGGLMLAVALGQWLLARGLAKEAPHAP